MLLGLIHHLEQNPPLPGEPYAAPLEGQAQPARLAMCVQPFAGGNPAAICRGRHVKKKSVTRKQPQHIVVHNNQKHQEQEYHPDGYDAFFNLQADIVPQQSFDPQHQDVPAI